MPDKFNQTVLNPGSENELTKNSDTSYSTKSSAGPDGEEHDVAINIVSLDFDGSFNIPPTAKGVIIYLAKAEGGSYEYVLEPLSFGLVPNFEKPKDPAAVKRGKENGPKYSKEVQAGQLKRFNCRKETISENKSVWTEPRKNLRCVIPIQGYFEWQKSKKEKPVYFVHLKDKPLLFLAGLYAHNQNYNDTEIVEDGQDYLLTFSIVTGPGEGEGSNDLLWLHERKPILLEPGTKEWFDWLTPNNKWDPKLADTSLNHKTNPAYDGIETYEVDKSIGKAELNGPDTLKPVKKDQKGINLFFKSENGKKPKKEEAGNGKAKKEDAGNGKAKKEEEDEGQEGLNSGDEEALQALEEEDKALPDDGVKDVDDLEDEEYEDDANVDVGEEGEEEAEIAEDEAVAAEDEEVPDVKEEVEDIQEEDKSDKEPGNIEIEEDEDPGEAEVDGDALEDDDVKAEEVEKTAEEVEEPKAGSKRGKSAGGRPKRGKR